MRATSLADVIRRNSAIGDEIPDNVFGGIRHERPPRSGPGCLGGAIPTGLNFVSYEGGSIEELESCARSLHITALYAVHDGDYVSYLLGAPDHVNRPFRELFADGFLPTTVLIAKSAGPPVPATDGE